MTDYLSILLEAATVAVGTLIVYMYLKSFFDFSSAKGYRVAAYAAFFIILAMLCVKAPYPILLISFTLLAVFFLSLFLYKGTVPRKIFAAVLFCCLMAVSEIASAGIIALMAQIEFYTTGSFSDGRIVSIVLSKFVQMLIVKLIGFYVQRKRASSYISFKWACPFLLGQAFLMILTHYILVTGYMEHDALTPLPIIMTLGILLLNLILFWYFDSVTAMFEYKRLNTAAEIRLEHQIKYYSLLEQRHLEMDSRFHDFNKHLAVIQELKKTAQSDEAQEYISELENSYKKTPGVVRTSHSTINAVLNYSLEKCEESEINTSLDIRLPAAIAVNPIELCVVLGNIFENAVEACEMIEKPSDRSISLTICQLNKALLIEMTNTFDRHRKKTKPGIHGLGLRNVSGVVEKCNGDMTCEAQDGLFSISIILP